MKANKTSRLVAIILIGWAAAVGTAWGNAMTDKTDRPPKPKYTNRLAKADSPYLRLHGHNPVDWYPWGPEAFARAKKENKLVVVSIGYAACHWCHVMEEESFSDEEVAAVMNAHFVSIKVDREERPDIDQVYMTAAQVLGGRGGWPLNVVALPDGKPIFAATYFTKPQWIEVLRRLWELYQKNPAGLEQQAHNVTEWIRKSENVSPAAGEPTFQPADLDRAYAALVKKVDLHWGGLSGAPKFPLPSIYQFMLAYRGASVPPKIPAAVEVTLERMARGGIYDQVGGGFARYATDIYWKVPHFEKMLYDNGQLVSLYADAYRVSRSPDYKRVVEQTLAFVEREMTATDPDDGSVAFYSSLDADSGGKEGLFYTWTDKELKATLGKDAALISTYYNVQKGGNWEDGRNVLYRTLGDEEFARAHGIAPDLFDQTIARAREKMQARRSRRPRPALDDKILTAWNAVMLRGYLDAYRALGEEALLEKALGSARFLATRMVGPGGGLYRSYNPHKKRADIDAFLDDYAFTAAAFISLYQVTFDLTWLEWAHKLVKYALVHFYDAETGMFYYTSNTSADLVARKKEWIDNVMPSSNAVMAENLYLLGRLFSNPDYEKKARRMVHNVKPHFESDISGFTHWAKVLDYFLHEPVEVALVGPDCRALGKELGRHYLPRVLFYGGKDEAGLPLLEGKLVPGQTTVYVCKDKTCQKPVTRADQALAQLKEGR